MALGYLEGYDGATLVVVASTGFTTLLAGYSVQPLIPKMDTAGEPGFQRYHRQSVALNGLAMLAVTIGLVASYDPGYRTSPAEPRRV